MPSKNTARDRRLRAARNAAHRRALADQLEQLRELLAPGDTAKKLQHTEVLEMAVKYLLRQTGQEDAPSEDGMEVDVGWRALGDVAVLCSSDGVVVAAVAGEKNTWGQDLEGWVGKHVAGLVVAEDRSMLMAALRRAAKESTRMHCRWKADDTTHVLELCVRPVHVPPHSYLLLHGWFDPAPLGQPQTVGLCGVGHAVVCKNRNLSLHAPDSTMLDFWVCDGSGDLYGVSIQVHLHRPVYDALHPNCVEGVGLGHMRAAMQAHPQWVQSVIASPGGTHSIVNTVLIPCIRQGRVEYLAVYSYTIEEVMPGATFPALAPPMPADFGPIHFDDVSKVHAILDSLNAKIKQDIAELDDALEAVEEQLALTEHTRLKSSTSPHTAHPSSPPGPVHVPARRTPTTTTHTDRGVDMLAGQLHVAVSLHAHMHVLQTHPFSPVALLSGGWSSPGGSSGTSTTESGSI